ncbi:hypothetical protein GCM10007891_18250 [Methylophaga thalassica]|uniref:Uncharacterized protein n=1 Tax=Methylophaga thalassica TaxID=40223 RepID=A0ABQ5TUX7_9GAMM|nr:hypothetical protein [Methylophaga thalassica]GLP99971.1 hypothetical protein GCM10007891_18250 [Methylophaga thalassica]
MDSFRTIVEEYKGKEGVAQLFGVLLYTDQHPNIKKVLRDEDYWLSFNELTGDRFCVFSVKPAKGKYEDSTSPRGGFFGMMVRIWKEPAENKKLIELFELEDTKNIPMLLLFTEIKGEFLKIELRLDDSSQDTAYSSIKEQLEFSCNALSQIKEENLKNTSGLYSALSLHQNDRLKWKLLTKSVDLYSYIKGLLP